MSRRARGRLRDFLRRLRAHEEAGEEDWDLLIRQARNAGLLARIAIEMEEAGTIAAAPAAVRPHFEAETNLARHQIRDVRWEVSAVKSALAGRHIPFVLLKGAAYVAANLPPARGRFFGDIDILVPRDRLGAAEEALTAAGWVGMEVDAYDERYYREWMHQIPPMTHSQRRSTIDLHHTIVAPSRGSVPIAEALLEAAIAVAGDPAVRVLAPCDMILHSATHLLSEGEFDRGLRDLDDLNLLLRQFGRDAGFWPMLIERAVELDLRRPLYFALRYASRLLGTPVPAEVLASERLSRPTPVLLPVLDAMFGRALGANHPSCHDALSGVALTILYIRGHLLLMPARMLIPHLIHKSLKRRRESREAATMPLGIR
jgi:hypothetical protein